MIEMGLQNEAIHTMLANPHLALFELIQRPCQIQYWTLMDHLVNIYKVKKIELSAHELDISIVRMAKTLASCSISENQGMQHLILVKDSSEAQKPGGQGCQDKPCLIPAG